MNLIDAVKSGRPFRRKHHLVWYAKFGGCLSERFRMGPNEDIHCELVMGDVIADDYEIQEPEVRVTRSLFLEMARKTWELDFDKTREAPEQFALQLAKRLGLET